MSELYNELIDAIRTELPEAELKIDKSQSGRYVIVKVGGKTIGYVNGSRKFRIDSPKLDKRVLIVNRFQIPVALEFLNRYKEAATA